MPTKKADKLTGFRLPVDVLEDMARLKRESGVPYSEMVRRALRAWLRQMEERPARRR